MSEPSAKARELVEALDRATYFTATSDPENAYDWGASDRKAALLAYIASLELDAKSGWDAFYKLRKAVGEDRYQGLTNVVRCADAARAAGQQGGE